MDHGDGTIVKCATEYRHAHLAVVLPLRPSSGESLTYTTTFPLTKIIKMVFGPHHDYNGWVTPFVVHMKRGGHCEPFAGDFTFILFFLVWFMYQKVFDMMQSSHPFFAWLQRMLFYLLTIVLRLMTVSIVCDMMLFAMAMTFDGKEHGLLCIPGK